MHDLLIALSFVAMVLTPCFVASKSGSSELEEAKNISPLYCGIRIKPDRSLPARSFYARTKLGT